MMASTPDHEFILAAATCTTMLQLLRKLGYRQAGGNYQTVRDRLHRLGVDTKHWTGRAHGKGSHLKSWGEYKSKGGMRSALIAQRGTCCEGCKNTEWLGQVMPLEIHHVDGDCFNNVESNLQILCPNCHALTDNWRGRALKDATDPRVKRASATCACGAPMNARSKVCRPCANRNRPAVYRIQWPELNVLRDMVAKRGYLSTGKSLGVSDNAVRKHLASG